MAKYNVNLGFEIDTNKLDKAIRDITSKMNELQRKGTLNGLAISDADKARYLAEMTNLRDAVNRVFTERRYGTDPTLRMGAAAPEIEAAARSLNTYNASLDNNSAMAQRAISQQTKLAEQMKKTREQVDPLQKMMNKLTGSFQAIALFSLAQFGFRGLTGTISDTIEYIKALDKSMTNIRIVTGASTDELRKFSAQYNQMAREMGRTTTEIADAFGTFYRQGLEGAQAAKMVEATVVGATVAGESLVEVADKLTSVINGFQLASDEAMSVMDKFAILDANMATSFKEMSYAMTKIASAAHNANMSLDETLALVATISEVTREAPENIGTALKTMVARMRGITDTGAITDETIQDMNKVDKALRSIGISQKDARGEMRNTYEVLDELGRKWNTLTSSQQSYVATAVAGSRQTTRFYAMIENWDKVMEAHDTSLNSSGKALEQFQEAQNSIEYQMKQTRAAMENLYSTFASSQTIVGANQAWQGLITTTTKFLEVINPMTIGIILLNRALASLAKHRLANLDFVKLGETAIKLGRGAASIAGAVRHPIVTAGNIRTNLANMGRVPDITAAPSIIGSTETSAANLEKMKVADALLKSMTLSKQQYNLLTQEEKNRYDQITNSLGIQRNRLQECFNIDKQRQEVLQRISTGTLVEQQQAFVQLKILAQDLGMTDVNRYTSAIALNAELEKELRAREGLASTELNRLNTQNRQQVVQMSLNALAKQALAESISMTTSLTMALMNYVKIRSTATNRFEAETAKIQYEIQSSTIAMQSLSSTAMMASNTFSQIGGKVGAIGGGIATVVGFGAQLLNIGIGIAKTIEQVKLNEKKKEIEEATTAVDNFFEQSTKFKELQKELLSIGDAFDTLSEGIDENGKNLHLTNEEFLEYTGYANRIAELMPELITGYTQQGNAILSNALSMQDYIDKLKDAEKAEAKLAKGAMTTLQAEKLEEHAFTRISSHAARYSRGEELSVGWDPFAVTKDTGKVLTSAAPMAIGGASIAGSIMGTTGGAALGAKLGAALGTTIAPVIGTAIGLALGAGIGLIIGIAVNSFTEQVKQVSYSTMDDLLESAEYKKASEKQKQEMERDVQSRMAAQARLEKQIALSVKETFDQSYEMAKLLSGEYDELNDKERQYVDLLGQRLDFTEMYAKMEREEFKKLQEDKEYQKADEEKQKEMYKKRMDGLIQELSEEQQKIVDALSMRPDDVERLFYDSRILEDKLNQGKITIEEYRDAYQGLKDKIISILEDAGIAPIVIENFKESFELSEVGSQLEKIIEKLKIWGFDIEALKNANIEMSLESIRGIEGLIKAYSRLDEETRKNLGYETTEEYGNALQKLIVEHKSLLPLITKWNNALNDGDYKTQNESMKLFREEVKKLAPDLDIGEAALKAMSSMAIQLSIDFERTKQSYASMINEFKAMSNEVDKVNEIFGKIDELGRISIDDILEVAGQFPELWQYIQQDSEGLLTLDPSGIRQMYRSIYEEHENSLKDLKQKVESEQFQLEGVTILGKIGVQMKKESGDIYNDVEDFLNKLGSLTDQELAQYTGVTGAQLDTIKQMVEMRDFFKDSLEPIVTENKLPDAINALKNELNEAEKSAESLKAQFEMLNRIDITVKITERIVTIKEEIDDTNWSLTENRWAIEDMKRSIDELPDVLAKAERAWEKAQKAWERAPRILEKAIKTYNKTMKKLVEDEAVLELEFKYDMSNFDIAPIANKIDLLKTSIELLGDADPSQSMQYYSEILSATVNKSALLNNEMERLMNTQAASGAEAKVLATEIDNVSKALMDNYKQGLEARNKINELAKKQQEEAVNNRKTMLENESKNMDLLTKSIDESIAKLQKGSWSRGLGGQLLIRDIFTRPDKAETDPVKIKQIQDRLMIEEHQKYLERVNELNKQAAKENYETTKAGFEDSRIDAEWALHDAYEANKDALIAYNEALKNYQKAQEENQRNLERMPYQLEQLEKKRLQLDNKLTRLNQELIGAQEELEIIEARRSDNLKIYLETLGYSEEKLDKVLQYWEDEAHKSETVMDNLVMIGKMTADELNAFLESDEVKSIGEAFFESLIYLSEETIDTQAEQAIKQLNDSMLKALKEGDYEDFTTKVNAVLNTGTLTPDLEKMYSDVSTKSDVFMNERKKKQEQLLDELVDYAGVTREAAEEALSDIKATLEDPTKEWTDTMKEVGKAIQKIFTDKPIVVPIDFELLDALANMPDYGFYTGTDKLRQYYSGTSKLQQYNTGTQGTPDEGVSMTGELGREVAILPNGQLKMLGENGPEMSYLPKGTIIYNHNDTEKILNYIKNPEQNKVQNYVSSNDIKNTQLQAYKDGTTSNFGPILSTYTKNWNNFNQKRTNKQGKTYYHQGNDLAAPIGTPIYAPMTGTVTYPFSTGRGLNSSAGYNVTLKLSNGYSMVAMHMNKPGVYDPGTQVPQGAIIGYVGNTGDSSGPHLHVELRSPNGNILNPSNYFSSYSGSVTGAPFVAQSSVSQLNAHLGGVFAGKGQTFENAAKKAGIDPYLLAAIAMHETGNGTSAAVRNKNNPGGIMSGPGGTLGNYSSLGSGVQAMADLLYRGYISQGLTTIEQIQKKYCPIGAKNDPLGLNKHWTSGVTKFYEMLSGQSYTGEFTSAGFNFQNLKYTLFDSVMSILSGDSKGSPLGDAATKAIRDRFGSLKTELSSLFGQRITDKNIASEAGVKPDQAFISNDASKLYKKNKDGSNTLLAMWDNAWKFATDETKTYGKTSTIGTYADGTDGTPRTEPAMVGEEGFEVAILPNGQIKLLGENGPEVVKLPKGTVIYDHDTSTMIKNYIPSVENTPMKTYASGTGDKIPTYANGTKKLSEMDDTEYEKEIERIIQRLKDFGIATENVTKLMSEIREDIKKATKLRQQWNEEEKKYFELRQAAYARGEGAEFELGMTLTKNVHEMVNSLIDSLVEQYIPADLSGEELTTFYEDERKRYMTMFKDDFGAFNRLVESINESASQELSIWNDINKKYINQYGQSLIDISAEAILQAEKTKLKIEKMHSDLYTMSKSTVITDIQKSYNAFAKSITSFYDALKAPDKIGFLSGETMRESWTKNITGLNNLSKLIGALGNEADSVITKMIANKRIVKTAELAYNEGKSFWGPDGFPSKMTAEQIQNIKDYAEYNNKIYRETFSKLGYTAEEAMKMGASINDNILALFDELGGTTSNALKDMISLANALNLYEAGASAQQINEAMEGASEHAKRYLKILTEAGTEAEKQAKLQKQMIDDLYKHSIKTQMALYEFRITSSEAEIKIETQRLNDYKQEAMSIYQYLSAGGTPLEGQLDRLNQLIEAIEKSENTISSLSDTIQSDMSAKFVIAYEQSFKRFNEELEKMNKQYERTIRLNESLKKGNNPLFNVKETKDILAYTTNKLSIIKEYIEGLKKAQLELAGTNKEAYDQIQKDIEAAQDEEFNLMIQQNELFFTMMEDSWAVVEKVLDRIQKRMDNLKFELGVKDTIADLEIALMEVDALRGIVDMSALYLTPDLDAAASYYREAINSSYDLLTANQKMLETRERLNNVQIDGFENIEDQKAAQKALNEEIQSTAFYYQKMAEEALKTTKQMKEQLNILKKEQAASKIAYDTLIKQKEDELAALQEAEKAEKEANNLLEAKLTLIKALDDVSYSYITGAGIEIMRPDVEKIDEAKAKVAELEREQTIQNLTDALQEEINALKEEADKKNQYYDAQINALTAMITAQEEIANRFQEEADNLRSDWLDIVTGIREDSLIQLEKSWSEHLNLIGDFKDGLDRWFSGDLTDKILIPITNDLEKASTAFETGIKIGEEIVKDFKDIIDEDLSDAIQMFNNTVEDWAEILGDIFGDGGSFHTNLSNWLSEYQNALNSAKYGSDYPGDKTGGGETSAGTTPIGKSEPKTEPKSETKTETEKPTDTSTPSTFPQLTTNYGDPYSIVDALKSVLYGERSNWPSNSTMWASIGGQSELTSINGLAGAGTATTNAQLLNLLKQGQLKKVPGYKTGGLADFTGLAWLDGTEENPELVLNAQDTANFIQLTNLLRKLELEELWNGMTIEFDEQGVIQNALREIADILMNQNKDNKIYIDNVNLPGVSSAGDFVNDLGQMVNFWRGQGQ